MSVSRSPGRPIAVLDEAGAAHTMPQRLLSDDGAALDPSRRGYLGRLVGHVSSLGVEAINGKPDRHPGQGRTLPRRPP